MTKTRLHRSLSLLLCMVLIAAMALCTLGCSENTTDGGNAAATTTTLAGTTTTTLSTAEGNVRGEGNTQFTFTVTDLDGKETSFTIKTDKATVGEALLEEELIAGEDGTYGLYVKTVNGITLDYDTDGAYWAFYVNGEYAMTGVDKTGVTDGETYSFKAEAA